MDRKIYRLNRRTFLTDLGKGVLGFTLLGAAACRSSGESTADGTGAGEEPTNPATSSRGLTVRRVNLGFVSAYVLIRGREAAVVDTGESGSAPDILAALEAGGMGWSEVDHLILTHAHPDHIGGVPGVLDNAATATPYAGTLDIPNIAASRDVQALEDGDEIFGLQVIGTPGHTAGHISIYDPEGQVLVAGDALNNSDGLARPPEQFNADQAQTDDSIRKLGGFDIDAIFFGHGDPIDSGAGDRLQALIADL